MQTNGRSSGDDDSIALELEGTAEDAAIARSALADLATRMGASERFSANAKLVVTEAFAYASRRAQAASANEGIVVEAEADAFGFTVVVRDWQIGSRLRISHAERDGLGFGLLAMLCDRIELCTVPGGGTEMRATLRWRRAD